MIFSLALLADASGPTSAFTGDTILVICLVGGAVVSAVCGILGLVISSRRHPSLAEDLQKTVTAASQNFATASKVDADVQRLHTRVDIVDGRINDFHSTLSKNMQDAERARGRMEGKLDLVITHFCKGASINASDNNHGTHTT